MYLFDEDKQEGKFNFELLKLGVNEDETGWNIICSSCSRRLEDAGEFIKYKMSRKWKDDFLHPFRTELEV